MWMHRIFLMEAAILLFIQDFIRNDILTPFFVFITSLGNGGCIWILISVALLFPKKTRKIGCMGICALLLSLLVNNMILKNLVARMRPYDAIEGLIPLVQKPVDFSFPSGHAASSLAAAGVFFRKLPKRSGVPLLLLAVLISLSRLYVGVHFPTDVLVGMISGWLLSGAAVALVERGAASGECSS